MSVRRELLLILVVAALLGAAGVGLGAFRVIGFAVRDSFMSRVEAETRLLAAQVRERPGEDHQALAAGAARSLGYRVTLIAADGTVVGDSARDRAGVLAMDNHGSRPEIVAAGRAGFGASYRTSDTTGVEYLYSARLVEGPAPARYVRIALPSSRVRAFQGRYAWLLAGTVLVVLLLLAGLAYTIVRRLSRPVEAMTAAAERAAAGDLRLEVPTHGRDEVGRLAAALNGLREAALARVAEREAEGAFLASVISGMHEGLLLVDSERRIRLANAAAREVLGLEFDPTDRLLTEVVRHPDVLRVIESALGEGHEPGETIVTVPGSGRSFELHATPLKAEDRPTGDVLALFFDITRLEALERVRRDFVANVSHELRTPLTSIKAFVETLGDGGLDDHENRERFLGIIRKHANRMEELIDDLTDLSLIETSAVQLELRSVDASRVAREVVENLGHLAKDVGVTVTVEMPCPVGVLADRRRLEQMLTNLVSNGIKFNRAGGTVRLFLEENGERHILVVEDTGEGIPEASLEKVFNRFHRVDPTRSRELGGTGLGLAIVKHLARLHGGRVWVESELGQGSRFHIELPAA